MFTKDLSDLSVSEVQTWISQELKGKGSNMGRDNLKKSFLRLKVDGKTLISLARRRPQREYRMGAYGVPKGLRDPLVEAVRNGVAKSSPVKPAIKGRGKPKFIGKRKVKMPDDAKVRDSPLSMALHMAKLDSRNKKTFDKNGWPKIELVVPPTAEESAKELEKAFKPSSELPQTIPGFRKMTSEEVASFVSKVLGNTVTSKKMAANVLRYKLTGEVLAAICTDKCKKRRVFRFSAYRFPATAAVKVTKAVRAALPYSRVEPDSKPEKIRCPDGVRVRNSAVAIAKYMALRYQTDKLRPGLKVWMEKNKMKKEAKVLKADEKEEKVLMRYLDEEQGVDEWVEKKKVVEKLPQSPIKKMRAERAATQPHADIRWDGVVLGWGSKQYAAVATKKKEVKVKEEKVSLRSCDVEQVGRWLKARVGGRSAKRLESILRKAKINGKMLLNLGKDGKKLSGPFNAMGVPYSLRKMFAKALRAEKKRDEKAMEEDKQGYADPKAHDAFMVKAKGEDKQAYKGKSTVTMPSGKRIRDSHIAIAKYQEVTVNKQPAFKEGFPEFEWASGGFQPLLAKSADEVAEWAMETLKEQASIKSLVKNLKQYKVDGEKLAMICMKTKGISGRLTAIGVPKSTRAALVKAVRAAAPKYKPARKARKPARIKCPDGKKVRNSTVAIAKHLRWQRPGYKPRAETEWPEIEIIAKPPKMAKRKLRKKSKKPLKSSLPKDKARQHKLDQHGWPEIDIVLGENQKDREPKFMDLGTQQVEMWMREKLGSHVGVKVVTQNVARRRITGKFLAELLEKKSRNGRMASMGVPYSLRKPLVQAIKGQDGIERADKTRRWVGLRTITLPDGKTEIRDSALSIGRHYTKLKPKKKETTKMKSNGWPSIQFVMAEDLDDPKAVKHGDMALMGKYELVNWVKETFKGEPDIKRLTKSIMKYRMSGDVAASLANVPKNRAYRLGQYAVPFGMRKPFVRAVRAETKDWSAPTKREYIEVDGTQIRNSKVSLILHMAKDKKNLPVKMRPEAQPDLLMMDTEQFSAWAGRKLRGTKGYTKMLSAALLRNGVTGKMFAELVVKKGKKDSRMARMQAFGVPRSNRRAFFELAQRTVPPAAQKLKEVRKFVGYSKCKLPHGKIVRDSPVTISRALDRYQKKASHKKTFNKQGWPKVEMVEVAKSKTPSPAKAKSSRPEPKMMVVGTSLLPSPKEKAEDARSMLEDLPDDLRKFSVDEVSRWVEARLEDRNLAARFIRAGINGRTLATLRDSRYGLSNKLSMLGVPMKMRAQLVRAVRREAKPMMTKPDISKLWFSEMGIPMRNSPLIIAKHLHETKGETVDIIRTEERLPGFRQMNAKATTSWVFYALKSEASGASASRSMRRLNVSGERLAAIVGEPKGRNNRLSAYGIPYSARGPLVRMVKRAAPEWEPAKKKKTVKCPDGSIIRDSTISIARWDAKQKKQKFSKRGPKVEIFLSARAPMKAMRNQEVLRWVETTGLKGHEQFRSLVAALQKSKADGEALVNATKKGMRTAGLSAMGIPISLRRPLLVAVMKRVKQDMKTNEAMYKEKDEVEWRGTSTIKIDGKTLRDSTASIAAYYGKKNKTKYSKEPTFYFEKREAKQMEKKKIKLETLNVKQLEEWLLTDVNLIHLNKEALTGLVATLKRYKVTGRKLAEVCVATRGAIHMLAAFGVRKNVRRTLISAVKAQMTDARTGYAVVPPAPEEAEKEAEKKNNTSEMILALRKAKAEGKKGLLMDWPDIELVHRAPAAKGGTQIVKTTIKKGLASMVEDQGQRSLVA